MSHLQTWEAWRDIHQPFELQWWKDALAKGHSADDAFMENHWAPMREFIKPRGAVLDIGCGPRPPFAPCCVIDPLVWKYLEITPIDWWKDVLPIGGPAEEIVEAWVGIFDTVICWNAIDHAIGWREILDNMLLYGKPDARYAIATDFHKPFTGHPGFEREAFMAEIDARFTIIDQREPLNRQLALLLERRVDVCNTHAGR